jgi:hypothetical protein
MGRDGLKSEKSKWKFFFPLILATVLLIAAGIGITKNRHEMNIAKAQVQLYANKRAEDLRIIKAGLKKFVASPKVTEWPGCNRSDYSDIHLTDFENGYCDGLWLSKSAPLNAVVSSFASERTDIEKKYVDFVHSGNDSEAICKLATDPKEWKYSDGVGGHDKVTNISEYVSGCKLGIKLGFNSGQNDASQQLARMQNSNNQPTPNQKSKNPASSGGTQGNGHWVSKCRPVLVPNPNYQGDQNSVSGNLANGPQNIFEQQCTDVYVSN